MCCVLHDRREDTRVHVCVHAQYVQLSISKEHVCVSRGKRLRSMLHMAVTVTLEHIHTCAVSLTHVCVCV